MFTLVALWLLVILKGYLRIIDARVTQEHSFTECQIRGQKESSTIDHLFLLKSVSAKLQNGTLSRTFLDRKYTHLTAWSDEKLLALWKNWVFGK